MHDSLQELGFLALTMAQAGAYALMSECGLRWYLEMYRKRRGGLLEEYLNDVWRIDHYK